MRAQRKLNQIHRTLGGFYSQMCRLSPTLMELLDLPTTLLISEEWGDSGFTDRTRIWLGSKKSPVDFACSLGHELQHCQQSPPDPTEGKEKFIQRNLDLELDAKLMEIQVVEDLRDSGIWVDPWFSKHLAVPQADRPAVYSQWLLTGRTSTTGETYPQFFERLWLTL